MPTLFFRELYVFFVMKLDTREVVAWHVTDHRRPTPGPPQAIPSPTTIPIYQVAPTPQSTWNKTSLEAVVPPM